METQTIKQKTVKGVIWQFAQKSFSQLAGFVVSVVLARILLPEDFGAVAAISIFMAIASTLVDSGLGASLIQTPKIEKQDLDTVFIFGLFLSVLFYLVLYFAAPHIAVLYKEPLLKDIVRVFGISLLFSSHISVQYSLLARNLDFKKNFYINLAATIVSGCVGIFMAMRNFGTWAIVGQHLCRTTMVSVGLGIRAGWHPSLCCSWGSLKKLYSFGISYMGSSIIGTIFNQLRGFLVGVAYCPADLAFYNRGESIPTAVFNNVYTTTSTVIFPAMSQVQDDKTAVKRYLRNTMKMSSFVIAPLMFMLLATSAGIIDLLYTDKWLASVPFMQVMCLTYLFSMTGEANLQAINAIGRSDITFKLEFIKKPLVLIFLLIGIRISPLAMCIANAVASAFCAAVNMMPNRKLIGYRYFEQIKDILPYFIIAAFCGGVVYLIGLLSIHRILLLFIQLGTGGVLYYLLIRLFDQESLLLFASLMSGFKK